jgi:nucleotide-binding universal stress UspA family protein
MSLNRILVADDGSDSALRAVEIESELAAKTGAELFALAVVDPGKYRRSGIEALARSEELEDGGALDALSMPPQHTWTVVARLPRLAVFLDATPRSEQATIRPGKSWTLLASTALI